MVVGVYEVQLVSGRKYHVLAAATAFELAQTIDQRTPAGDRIERVTLAHRFVSEPFAIVIDDAEAARLIGAGV